MSEYRYINIHTFKGKLYIFSLILYAGVALGILVLKSTSQFDEEGRMLLNILLVLVTLPIVFLGYEGFMKKVAVTPEGLSLQTPFSSFTIPWKTIRSMGAFRAFRYLTEPIAFSDIDKTLLFGTVWLYCSTLPREKVIYKNKKNVTIVFPYRREILEEINQYVEVKKLAL